jgi:hypothetical protein
LVAGGRLDFALTGVCGDAVPSAEFGLSWREVAVDPVLVLLPRLHRRRRAAHPVDVQRRGQPAVAADRGRLTDTGRYGR